MRLIQELRHTHATLWHRTVTHPFVLTMGEGTLPPAVFRTYFLQDYVFVRDLVAMTAMGMAKAPTVQAASRLNQFLGGILHPENDLFVRAFALLGASPAEYTAASALPVTQAFGDFLVRTGLQGTFEDIATILYVTEGTYLDWGTRLLQAGKRPEHPVYREWIDLHGPEVLGALVAWLEAYLNDAVVETTHARIASVFHTALRYEYLFWEQAYGGGYAWPEET